MDNKIKDIYKLHKITNTNLRESKVAFEKNLDFASSLEFIKINKWNERNKNGGQTKNFIFIFDNKAVIMEVDYYGPVELEKEKLVVKIGSLAKGFEKKEANEINNLEFALNNQNAFYRDKKYITNFMINNMFNIRKVDCVYKRDNEIFGSYVHVDGKSAALVVLENGSDEMAHDLAMHVVAKKPKYIFPENIPIEIIENEKRRIIEFEYDLLSSKTNHAIKKIVEGKINLFIKQICMTKQTLVKAADFALSNHNTNTYLKNIKVPIEENLKADNSILQSVICYDSKEYNTRSEDDLSNIKSLQSLNGINDERQIKLDDDAISLWDEKENIKSIRNSLLGEDLKSNPVIDFPKTAVVIQSLKSEKNSEEITFNILGDIIYKNNFFATNELNIVLSKFNKLDDLRVLCLTISMKEKNNYTFEDVANILGFDKNYVVEITKKFVALCKEIMEEQVIDFEKDLQLSKNKGVKL